MDVFNADEVRYCSPDEPGRVLILGIQTGNIDRIGDILPSILSGATAIYTDVSAFNAPRSSLHRYLYGTRSGSERLKQCVDYRKVKPLRPILNEMRMFKSEDEVVQMRRVGQASGRSFTHAMRQTFTREKELDAFLEYQFKTNGCDTRAFVPVVAGGSVSPLWLTRIKLMNLEFSEHPLHEK